MTRWPSDRGRAVHSQLVAGLVLACVVQSPPQAPVVAGSPAPQPHETDAVCLFNGVNLDGWNSKDVRPGRVTVGDGMLVLGAKSGWLLTEERYSDFTLRFEARMSSGSRGGLLVRVLRHEKSASAYEVPLANGQGAAGGLLWHRGPQVHTVLAEKPVTLAITEGWQSFSVECRLSVVRVTIDGIDVLHAKGLVQNVGQIGFFVTSGEIDVRNLQLRKHDLPVRELPPGVYRSTPDGKVPVRPPSLEKEVKPRYTLAALVEGYQGEGTA